MAKETYDFEDRGGDSLTLRPEGTAGVMRAIAQHGLAGGQGALLRLYYINSHFRYERPQRGRYRQHHQVGVEYIGADGPQADVEVIALGMTYLAALGLTGLQLQINSVGTPACRPAYRSALQDHLRPHLGDLSEDSQRRFETNPLRVLDSKDPRDQAVIADAPVMVDYLDAEAADHFAAVQAGLADLGLPCELNPRLVRGLDYYQKTAFEVVSSALGSQNVVLGGGRYDGLLASLGGPALGGVGFGSGIERALLILEQTDAAAPAPAGALVYVVAREPAERALAARLAADWRRHGISADYDLQGRSQKAQLRAANGAGAAYVVFVRDDLPAGRAQLKEMASGEQVELTHEELGARLLAATRNGR